MVKILKFKFYLFIPLLFLIFLPKNANAQPVNYIHNGFAYNDYTLESGSSSVLNSPFGPGNLPLYPLGLYSVNNYQQFHNKALEFTVSSPIKGKAKALKFNISFQYSVDGLTFFPGIGNPISQYKGYLAGFNSTISNQSVNFSVSNQTINGGLFNLNGVVTFDTEIDVSEFAIGVSGISANSYIASCDSRPGSMISVCYDHIVSQIINLTIDVELITDLNSALLDSINNNQQITNDKLDNIDSTLTDDSSPDVSGFLDSIKVDDSNSPVSDLITMPLTLMQSYVNGFSSSCQSVNLGNLYGYDLVFSCIDIKKYLGNTLYSLVDMLFCIFMAYNIGMMCISIYESITSLDDTMQLLYTPQHAGHSRVNRGESEGLY